MYPFTVSPAKTSSTSGPSNTPVQEVAILSSSGLDGVNVTLIKEFTYHPRLHKTAGFLRFHYTTRSIDRTTEARCGEITSTTYPMK